MSTLALCMPSTKAFYRCEFQLLPIDCPPQMQWRKFGRKSKIVGRFFEFLTVTSISHCSQTSQTNRKEFFLFNTGVRSEVAMFAVTNAGK